MLETDSLPPGNVFKKLKHCFSKIGCDILTCNKSVWKRSGSSRTSYFYFYRFTSFQTSICSGHVPPLTMKSSYMSMLFILLLPHATCSGDHWKNQIRWTVETELPSMVLTTRNLSHFDRGYNGNHTDVVIYNIIESQDESYAVTKDWERFNIN